MLRPSLLRTLLVVWLVICSTVVPFVGAAAPESGVDADQPTEETTTTVARFSVDSQPAETGSGDGSDSPPAEARSASSVDAGITSVEINQGTDYNDNGYPADFDVVVTADTRVDGVLSEGKPFFKVYVAGELVHYGGIVERTAAKTLTISVSPSDVGVTNATTVDVRVVLAAKRGASNSKFVDESATTAKFQPLAQQLTFRESAQRAVLGLDPTYRHLDEEVLNRDWWLDQSDEQAESAIDAVRPDVAEELRDNSIDTLLSRVGAVGSGAARGYSHGQTLLTVVESSAYTLLSIQSRKIAEHMDHSEYRELAGDLDALQDNADKLAEADTEAERRRLLEERVGLLKDAYRSIPPFLNATHESAGDGNGFDRLAYEAAFDHAMLLRLTLSNDYVATKGWLRNGTTDQRLAQVTGVSMPAHRLDSSPSEVVALDTLESPDDHAIYEITVSEDLAGKTLETAVMAAQTEGFDAYITSSKPDDPDDPSNVVTTLTNGFWYVENRRSADIENVKAGTYYLVVDANRSVGRYKVTAQVQGLPIIGEHAPDFSIVGTGSVQSYPDPEIRSIDVQQADGDVVLVNVTVANVGGTADWMSIAVGVPNASAEDVEVVSDSLENGARVYKPGEEVGAEYGNTTMSLNYPLVEGSVTGWEGGTRSLTIRVQLGGSEVDQIQVKSVARGSGAWTSAPEAGAAVDQQSEFVVVRNVSVSDDGDGGGNDSGTGNEGGGDGSDGSGDDGSDGGDSTESPTAAFEAAPTTANVSEGVTFDASGSADPDGSIVSYEWSFDDGSTATGETVQHSFDEPGTYEVTLTVTDGDGATNTTTRTVTIREENTLPTASFTVDSPPGATTDDGISFDAGESSDPDGSIVSYEWSFGDGSSATGVDVDHRFDEPVTYNVTLTVTDDRGGTATTTRSVRVRAAPGSPVWSTDFDKGANHGPTVVDGVAYVTTQAGLNYTLRAVDISTHETLWTFALPGDVEGRGPGGVAVVDGTAYVTGNGGAVHAIDTTDGDLKWTFEPDKNSSSSYPSPTVADGLVFVSSETALYAVYASNGTRKWRWTIQGGFDNAKTLGGDTYGLEEPVVVDETVYIGIRVYGRANGSLYAIDAATGQERWNHTTGDVFRSPTVTGGFVYATTRRGVYALHTSTGQKEWKQPLVAGGLSAVMTVADGTLFVGGEGKLYALDASDGTTQWRGNWSGSRITWGVTVASGTVYAVAGDTSVFAFDAATGESLWRQSVRGARGPIVVNGTLYVGMRSGLAALRANHSASSRGSRVRQAIVNHHGGFTTTGPTVPPAGDGGGNDPPNGAFDTSPDSWGTSDTLTFDASESTDPDGTITSYEWSFGDGSTATGRTVRHSYDEPGNYTVTLTVTDDDGATYTVRRTLAPTRQAGTPKWTLDTGYSPPTVVDGTVYVQSGEKIQAVNASSGEVVWTARGPDIDDEFGPQVVDGTVFVTDPFTLGGVAALNASDGSVIWNSTIGSGQPLVADGTLYVGGPALYAFNPTTGEEKWAYHPDSSGVSSPTAANGTVYAVMGGDTVCAVDGTDGTREWCSQIGEFAETQLMVAGGRVFVAGSDNGTLYSIDATTGSLSWTYEPDSEIVSMPTVADGTVYVGTLNGSLLALEASDGERKWRFVVPRNVDLEGIVSSPTVAGGTVYVGSLDNYVYAVDAATGTQKWRYRTEYRVQSAPTVVDGVLYVGAFHKLHAVITEHRASSGGSRVRLGTVGHHDTHADQDLPPVDPTENGSWNVFTDPTDAGARFDGEHLSKGSTVVDLSNANVEGQGVSVESVTLRLSRPVETVIGTVTDPAGSLNGEPEPLEDATALAYFQVFTKEMARYKFENGSITVSVSPDTLPPGVTMDEVTLYHYSGENWYDLDSPVVSRADMSRDGSTLRGTVQDRFFTAWAVGYDPSATDDDSDGTPTSTPRETDTPRQTDTPQESSTPPTTTTPVETATPTDRPVGSVTPSDTLDATATHSDSATQSPSDSSSAGESDESSDDGDATQTQFPGFTWGTGVVTLLVLMVVVRRRVR